MIFVLQFESRCTVNSSSLILCPTPAVGPEARRARVKVNFLLDSLHFDFSAVGREAFSYEPNPKLYTLNLNDPSKPYHHKPGSIISVEVEDRTSRDIHDVHEHTINGVTLSLSSRERTWIWPSPSTRWRPGSGRGRAR